MLTKWHPTGSFFPEGDTLALDSMQGHKTDASRAENTKYHANCSLSLTVSKGREQTIKILLSDRVLQVHGDQSQGLWPVPDTRASFVGMWPGQSLRPTLRSVSCVA